MNKDVSDNQKAAYCDKACIPNVFHFVFGLQEQKSPFHLMHYLCLKSCLKVQQPEKIVFHYHYEPYGEWWDLIKPELTLKKIEPDQFISSFKYENQKIAKYRYAHLADVARLEILLEEGGIYADIDTLFLQPLPESLFFNDVVMGYELAPPSHNGSNSICNAWIASTVNSFFCRKWLEEMYNHFDGTWSNHSTLLPYLLSQKFPQSIHLEPESSFFSLNWTPKGVGDIFTNKVKLSDKAYSLHLWSHLWFEKERQGFSAFHADLLTIDYVAFANTTYARNARAFLPDGVCPKRRKYVKQYFEYLRLRNAISRQNRARVKKQ